MTQEIGWDEALTTGKYVKLDEGEEKKMLVTNHRLERIEKFDKEVVEFQCDVLEEDGDEVDDEKLFTTASNRLKKKLRPIFENKLPTDKTRISIIKIGDKFDTQYGVKELKE